MLKKLSKNHEEWLRIANGICKDKETAKDLVQDMYITMYETDKKYSEVNKWYIYRVMFSAFLNSIKKKRIKTVSINDYFNIIKTDSDLTHLEQLQCIDDALNEIGLIDKRYLIETHTRSLRKNAKYLNIPVSTLHYQKHKAIEKLNRTDIVKKFRKL